LGAASPGRGIASTFCGWARADGAVGSGTSDTNDSVGIVGVGTVFFHNYTLSAQWGRFTARNGVLRTSDGSRLSVPVTGPLEGTTLQGDGWSATLNSGWVSGAGGATGVIYNRPRELIFIADTDRRKRSCSVGVIGKE
jgi:hypothetical protein